MYEDRFPGVASLDGSLAPPFRGKSTTFCNSLLVFGHLVSPGRTLRSKGTQTATWEEKRTGTNSTAADGATRQKPERCPAAEVRAVKGACGAARQIGTWNVRRGEHLSTAVLGAEELKCTGTEHLSQATIKRATLEMTEEMMWPSY